MNIYTFDVTAVVRVLLPSGWHDVKQRMDQDHRSSTFLVGSYDVTWRGDHVYHEDPGFAFTDDNTGESIFGPLSAVHALAADPDWLRASRSAPADFPRM